MMTEAEAGVFSGFFLWLMMVKENDGESREKGIRERERESLQWL
jgi:hypothetical protein